MKFSTKSRAVAADRMTRPTHSIVGVLVSGGLDSSILVAHLLDQERRVQPIYIRSGLYWQTVELRALEQYLAVIANTRLDHLTVLDLPLADIYNDHWSITGRNVPAAGTPDEAVFLPGRNVLLTIKAALWCQGHGIEQLAIGTLGQNPFADASEEFFHQLEQVVAASGSAIQFEQPFSSLGKLQVLELGRHLPLADTFSCLAPRLGLHCGECNKCAERRNAFQSLGCDPTRYASGASSPQPSALA